jgi:hypothetical protein
VSRASAALILGVVLYAVSALLFCVVPYEEPAARARLHERLLNEIRAGWVPLAVTADNQGMDDAPATGLVIPDLDDPR